MNYLRTFKLYELLEAPSIKYFHTFTEVSLVFTVILLSNFRSSHVDLFTILYLLNIILCIKKL